MLIGLAGRCKAKINGKETELREKEMMFIPANVTHEFWNPYETRCEAILLMFGDGA